MTTTASTLSRLEIERLESSLKRREPGRVAPEVLDRVVQWAIMARQQNQSCDLVMLNGILSGEFEVSVVNYDRPGGGHASDPRLMFWSPPPADSPPLACIAHHEAGHAAMHIRAGRRFRYVSIQPDDTTLGHCMGWSAPPRFRPDIEVTPAGERYLRDRIVSLLAGELADTRHCGRLNETVLHIGDDLATAVDLANYVVGNQAELDTYIGWLRARAETQLARREVWAGVQGIAVALLEHSRLTYSQAGAAWQAAVFAYLESLHPVGHPAFVSRVASPP